MPLYLAALAFQILFAVHAWRTGRDRFWLYILLLFPGVGCLLYFIVEIAPEFARGKEAQGLRQWFAQKQDPDKAVRDAEHALSTTPTVANRLRLARVLMARHDYDGVIATLTPARAGHFADDPAVLEGLAYAHFYRQDYAAALALTEEICAHPDWTPKDYIKLLRARLYVALGESDRAKAAYEALLPQFSGEEARIDYAHLLAARGDTAGAQEIYADIVRRAPHTPKHYQEKQKEWIETARKNLRA